MSFKYCILPSGNSGEFFKIDFELLERGVTAHYRQNARGTRVYRIAESELDKLPHDGDGPYLGDDNSGHSIYNLHDADEYCDEIRCAAWVLISAD